MENLDAYNTLDELQRDGKIEANTAAEAKEKFYRLHEALSQNIENETHLMKKARALHKDFNSEMLKLEKT